MELNFKPTDSFVELRKPIPFPHCHTDDAGSLQCWAGRIIPVSPFSFGILFANDIKRFYQIELWQDNNEDFRKHVFLCQENGLWQMGLVNDCRFDEKRSKFLDELRDRLVEDYFQGAD